jgi:hypothetical protein
VDVQGFEEIQYLLTHDGAYLLGLCEGNHCKGGEVRRWQLAASQPAGVGGGSSRRLVTTACST